MPYTADFETLISTDKTRVWAWACMDIETRHFYYGNSIEGFIEFCKENPDKYYFHNLKFDGEFIIHYLLTNGFEYTTGRKLASNQFTAIIADSGQWYTMSVCFHSKSKVQFIDSLKILPFSVEQIAKAFALPISKLKIDYTAYREEGHELTQEEISYIHNDVAIVASALKTLFDEGLTKLTQASNAMYDYKLSIGKKAFEYWYPLLENDDTLRKSYKGGFTYLNDKYINKEVKDGIVLDVNSLYPSVMYYELLPYGEPRYYKGKYKDNEQFPLYIQFFTCCFDVKKDHIPTLQLKHSMFFKQNEYIKSSNGRDYDLCMTSVDLQLFFQQYDVYNIEWHFGYMFRGAHDMFKAYIDKWVQVKINADIEGNNGMRTLAKLMLNALYGRFGLNPNCTRKIPYLDNGVVKYMRGDDETRDPVYVPMASFITAYARYKTITSAQSVYNRFIYADTDSLHLEGLEIPDNLYIHDTALGAWKHESTFDKAKFLRQKCYIEHWTMHKNKQTDTNNITCAGLPKNCVYACNIIPVPIKGGAKAVRYKKIDFSNFTYGMKSFGKLVPKHVVGGVVLFGTDFTIK